MKALKESLRQGLMFDGAMQMYPSRLWGFVGGRGEWSDESHHSYVYACSNNLELHVPQGRFTLSQGMYASIPGRFELTGDSSAAVFQRIGFRGLFHIGGPLEEMGRLTYIDNCTTTLIGPPARNGDPCFNALFFPPNLEQTPHIHPTLRLGFVAAGSGKCLDGSQDEIPLNVGDVFVLSAGFRHCFYSGDEGLIVLAFHPDSEGGPTDESHPMLNRTFMQV